MKRAVTMSQPIQFRIRKDLWPLLEERCAERDETPAKLCQRLITEMLERRAQAKEAAK